MRLLLKGHIEVGSLARADGPTEGPPCVFPGIQRGLEASEPFLQRLDGLPLLRLHFRGLYRGSVRLLAQSLHLIFHLLPDSHRGPLAHLLLLERDGFLREQKPPLGLLVLFAALAHGLRLGVGEGHLLREPLDLGLGLPGPLPGGVALFHHIDFSLQLLHKATFREIEP